MFCVNLSLLGDQIATLICCLIIGHFLFANSLKCFLLSTRRYTAFLSEIKLNSIQPRDLFFNLVSIDLPSNDIFVTEILGQCKIKLLLKRVIRSKGSLPKTFYLSCCENNRRQLLSVVLTTIELRFPYFRIKLISDTNIHYFFQIYCFKWAW